MKFGPDHGRDPNRDITTPFGDYKQSGFGGRDNSIHAHDQYTELKTLRLDVSDSNIESGLD